MSSNVYEPGTAPALVANEDFAYLVTALFDRRDHAETARQDLIASGIHAEAIVLVAGRAGEHFAASEIDDPSAGGFWQTLKDLFMPQEDSDQYAEGVRRGGATLSVRTDTANHDRVVALLDRDGAVDLDERREQWRHDGWTGYTGADPLAQARSPALTTHADNEDMGYAAASAATAGFGVSNIDRLGFDDETAPAVDSPGALPPSALDAAPETPASDVPAATTPERRDPARGTGRVRSYVWTVDRSVTPRDEP